MQSLHAGEHHKPNHMLCSVWGKMVACTTILWSCTTFPAAAVGSAPSAPSLSSKRCASRGKQPVFSGMWLFEHMCRFCSPPLQPIPSHYLYAHDGNNVSCTASGYGKAIISNFMFVNFHERLVWAHSAWTPCENSAVCLQCFEFSRQPIHKGTIQKVAVKS